MLLNALFPTRDIGTDPAKIRDFGAGRRRARLSRHRGRRPRVRRGAARRLEADLQRVRSVPRDLHDHGVHRRGDEEGRAGERRADPAAAPDRAGRQAGGAGRHPERRPLAAGRRRRLEPCRVRGAQHRVEDARRAAGRADRGDAQAVDRGPRHLPRQVPHPRSPSTSCPCRCSGRSRSGSAARRMRWSSAPRASATATCRS